MRHDLDLYLFAGYFAEVVAGSSDVVPLADPFLVARRPIHDFGQPESPRLMMESRYTN